MSSKYARRKSRSRRRVTHRKHRKNTVRRRRTRRNPWPMAGAVVNPRRKRRGRKGTHRKHRKHYRRNPAILGLTLPPLESVLYAGAGFILTPMVEGFANKILPVSITSTAIGKYAVRLGSVLALSYAARMVIGRSQANMVTIGGGAYVLTTAIGEFAPDLKKALGLGTYQDATQGLSAYTAPTSRTFNQLGGPAWGAMNTPHFGPRGSMNIVAQRFRRFQ